MKPMNTTGCSKTRRGKMLLLTLCYLIAVVTAMEVESTSTEGKSYVIERSKKNPRCDKIDDDAAVTMTGVFQKAFAGLDGKIEGLNGFYSTKGAPGRKPKTDTHQRSRSAGAAKSKTSVISSQKKDAPVAPGPASAARRTTSKLTLEDAREEIRSVVAGPSPNSPKDRGEDKSVRIKAQRVRPRSASAPMLRTNNAAQTPSQRRPTQVLQLSNTGEGDSDLTELPEVVAAAPASEASDHDSGDPELSTTNTMPKRKDAMGPSAELDPSAQSEDEGLDNKPEFKEEKEEDRVDEELATDYKHKPPVSWYCCLLRLRDLARGGRSG